MSTSDLMQTDADAIADPCTTAMRQKVAGASGEKSSGGQAYDDGMASSSHEGLDGYKQGQYLQTSDISDYKVDS